MGKLQNISTPLIFLTILLVGVVAIMSASKDSGANAEPKAVTLDTDRYEVLDAFRMPTTMDSYAGDRGMIIKDRKVPDTCFLYIKVGGHNGNVTLERTPCEKQHLALTD